MDSKTVSDASRFASEEEPPWAEAVKIAGPGNPGPREPEIPRYYLLFRRYESGTTWRIVREDPRDCFRPRLRETHEWGASSGYWYAEITRGMDWDYFFIDYDEETETVSNPRPDPRFWFAGMDEALEEFWEAEASRSQDDDA